MGSSGITSEFDLQMFREAKAKACEDLKGTDSETQTSSSSHPARDVAKRDLRKPFFTAEQKLRKKQIKALRKRTEISEEIKNEMVEHHKRYQKSREPLLKGITSEFDLQMFREAK